MTNVILIMALVLILGGAAFYVCRAKRRGVKCIGCPAAKTCGGNCAGCSCNCRK